MLQVTPQMRVLVAVEPVDFRPTPTKETASLKMAF